MVLVEAMACGAPVLATDRGAVREIVRDGVTGFVRDTTAELGALVDRLGEIDRAACRRHVAEHFSRTALVHGSERLLAPLSNRLDLAAVAPMVFRSPVAPVRPVRAGRGANPAGPTPAQATR
jgi:hypothetical protein